MFCMIHRANDPSHLFTYMNYSCAFASALQNNNWKYWFGFFLFIHSFPMRSTVEHQLLVPWCNGLFSFFFRLFGCFVSCYIAIVRLLFEKTCVTIYSRSHQCDILTFIECVLYVKYMSFSLTKTILQLWKCF